MVGPTVPGRRLERTGNGAERGGPLKKHKPGITVFFADAPARSTALRASVFPDRQHLKRFWNLLKLHCVRWQVGFSLVKLWINRRSGQSQTSVLNV